MVLLNDIHRTYVPTREWSTGSPINDSKCYGKEVESGVAMCIPILNIFEEVISGYIYGGLHWGNTIWTMTCKKSRNLLNEWGKYIANPGEDSSIRIWGWAIEGIVV